MTDAALQLALRAYDNELIFEGRSKVKARILESPKMAKRRARQVLVVTTKTREAENMEGFWVPNEGRT